MNLDNLKKNYNLNFDHCKYWRFKFQVENKIDKYFLFIIYYLLNK